MRNTIKCLFVANPFTTQISLAFLSVLKYYFIDHKLVFATIRTRSVSLLFQWKQILLFHVRICLICQICARSLQVVERQVIGQQFLGSFVSLLSTNKYVVPSHIHLVAFSGFCIISFNNLVNVTWDDERAFNQKFGTLSIPGDFYFWDLVDAALSSSTPFFINNPFNFDPRSENC